MNYELMTKKIDSALKKNKHQTKTAKKNNKML